MAFNLDGLELSEEQVAQINKQNEGLVSASEIEGLRQNRDDLLAEKKAIAASKLLSEEKAESEHLLSLQKDNDYKALSKSYEDKLSQYEQRDKDNALKIQKQAVGSKALEMAKSISSGDNADLLATFIEQRLRSEDGEIKVTDSNGGLTISTYDDLLNEFKTSQKFASLVVATKASGGRASDGDKIGSAGSVPSSKKTYSDLSLKEQVEYNRNVNPIRN